MQKKWWSLSYFAASGLLLVLAYIFEEAGSNRSTVLIILTGLFVLMAFISRLKKVKDHIFVVMALVSVLILFTLEYYSKYAINYFYHTLYLLVVGNFMTLGHKKGIIGLSVFATGISFVKFVELIVVETTFANISLMVFFGSFQILIVVVALFLRFYQDETKKTKGLYRELLEAHSQLSVYSKEIKELSQLETRSNIARDLHDTLGHELTGLIMQMEIMENYLSEGELEKVRTLVKEVKQGTRDSLTKVRQIVETLKSTSDPIDNLEDIKELCQTFRQRTGCEVSLEESGTRPLTLELKTQLTLYRVLQESLTNAVRHGRASKIMIRLIYEATLVRFTIQDNGIGCSLVKENNGLAGMRERVQAVDGTLKITGKPRFKVSGHLPY